MRSISLKFASAFALLAALTFVAVGAAMAQDGGKWNGGAYAGFGQVNWDKGTVAAPGSPSSGSSYNTQIEANIIYSGKQGPMDYLFRMRARGTQGNTEVKDFTEGTFNDGQLQTVRVRVGWNVSDAFRIEIGRLPSIGGVGYADLQFVRAPASFRHFNDNYAMWDSGAINLSFKVGGIKAGLAISADCQVACLAGQTLPASSTTIDAGTSTITVVKSTLASKNQSTMLPYVQADLGAVKVGFRYAASQGKAVGSYKEDDIDIATGGVTAVDSFTVDETVKSTGMVLEAAYTTPGFGVAFEYTGTTYKPFPSDVGAKDFKNTQIALSATFAGGGLVQYSTSKDDDGLPAASTAGVDKTVMSAAYLMDVGSGGQVGPEVVLASEKAQVTGAKEAKGTLIRLLLRTSF